MHLSDGADKHGLTVRWWTVLECEEVVLHAYTGPILVTITGCLAQDPRVLEQPERREGEAGPIAVGIGDLLRLQDTVVIARARREPCRVGDRGREQVIGVVIHD